MVGGKAGFYHNFSACVTTGDSTPPPLRGWIVPVGDAIPDRLKKSAALESALRRAAANDS